MWVSPGVSAHIKETRVSVHQSVLLRQPFNTSNTSIMKNLLLIFVLSVSISLSSCLFFGPTRVNYMKLGFSCDRNLCFRAAVDQMETVLDCSHLGVDVWTGVMGSVAWQVGIIGSSYFSNFNCINIV